MTHHHSHDHDHAHDHGSDHDGHGHGRAGHSHDHAEGADRNRVLVVACLTGGFMIVEAVGGMLTGSLALIADAGHMLTNSIALWLAWFAFKFAQRPATGNMTYGFGRLKTLAAYTNGVTIFLIAIWICYEAVVRLLDPPEVLAGVMLWVAVAGLLVNIIGFAVLHGGDRENLNMRGALVHVAGDLLGSVAAIVAALIIMATGWTPIDPILSVLVAVIILTTAWRLIRDAAHILLEGVPRNVNRDAVARDIETNIQGVVDVHHMHVWSIDGTGNVATLHARIEEDASSMTIVVAIKQRLAARHQIKHATVEIETGACADADAAHDHA